MLRILLLFILLATTCYSAQAQQPPKRYYWYAFAEDVKTKLRLYTAIDSVLLNGSMYGNPQVDSLRHQWERAVRKDNANFGGTWDVRLDLNASSIQKEFDNFMKIATDRGYTRKELVYKPRLR